MLKAVTDILKEQISFRKGKITVLKLRRYDVKHKIDSLQSECTGKIEKRIVHCQEMQAKSTSPSEIISLRKEMIDMLKEMIDILKEQISYRKGTIAELKQAILLRYKFVSKVMQNIELKDLQDSLSALTDDINSFKQEIDHLINTCGSANDQLRSDIIRFINEKMESTTGMFKDQIDSLMSTLVSIVQEGCEQELPENLKVSLNSAISNAVKKKITELKLETLSDEVTTLEKQTDSLRSEFVCMAESVLAYQDKLDSGLTPEDIDSLRVQLVGAITEKRKYREKKFENHHLDPNSREGIALRIELDSMRYKVIRVIKGRIEYLTQKQLDNQTLYELTITLRDQIKDSFKPKVVSLINEGLKQASAVSLEDQINFLRHNVTKYTDETCTIYPECPQNESTKTLKHEIILLNHTLLVVINERVSPQYLTKRLRSSEESTVTLTPSEISSLTSDIAGAIEERIRCLETMIDHQLNSKLRDSELVDSLKSESDSLRSAYTVTVA